MIFKQPSNGSGKIGRKVEFTDPLRHSNKKHYWAGGVGNYGLLTTEQIQMLNQMKQKQKKANLYNTKFIQQSLNHSIKKLKYQGTERLKTEKKQCCNSFELNRPPQNRQCLTNQSFDPRQRAKRRSVSEFRSYDQVEPETSKFNTIANQQNHSGFVDFNNTQNIKRVGSNRKAKTMGVQQIEQIQNPQEVNKIDQMFSRLVNREKLPRKNLRIESGNVRLNHSPDSLKIISKSNEKHNQCLQPNIYSERFEQKTDLVQTRNIEELKQEILNQPDKIYKKVKRLDPKILTRHKFRRDYSPTYCNSIEYPLKYFRHV